MNSDRSEALQGGWAHPLEFTQPSGELAECRLNYYSLLYAWADRQTVRHSATCVLRSSFASESQHFISLHSQLTLIQTSISLQTYLSHSTATICNEAHYTFLCSSWRYRYRYWSTAMYVSVSKFDHIDDEVICTDVQWLALEYARASLKYIFLYLSFISAFPSHGVCAVCCVCTTFIAANTLHLAKLDVFGKLIRIQPSG